MREWIVTNGIGGYSSLTNNFCNTRKFHGLLVASLNPPTERWVLIPNIFDSFQIGNKTIKLKTMKSEFNFDFFPSFTYKKDDIEIKKEVFMQNKKNTTIIKYNIKTKKPFTMIHKPLVNSRHIYDVNKSRYLEFKQEIFDNLLVVKPQNLSKSIKIFLNDSEYEKSPCWYEFYYEKDHERNDSWIDNNMKLGLLKKPIKEDSEYYIAISLEDEIDIKPSEIYFNEIKRKKKIIENSQLHPKFKKLIVSSDNFIVDRGQEKTVIAGYHWFGDWGRDTLIALPGLTLVTKRFDEAKQILLSFSKYCRNGLIPNAFMERDSKAVYNTVDASLWFIDRVYQYLKYTNDREFIDNIWSTLESIISNYRNGTEYDIKMDDDFLISHGPGLTWMDVKINNYYITPRSKKAVEIQALWYNSLKIMSNLSKVLDKKDDYLDISENVKKSFNSNYDRQYDVIDCSDLSFRPNQIFLVSLENSMIDNDLQKKIVKDIEEKLLTVFGLRTLSEDDTKYKGIYIGNFNKDEAYHNGTVWPWLLGSFIKSYVKVHNYKKNKREYAYDNFLKPMIDVFGDQWDGNINEIFDGDPVYIPRGCITQAWSVAEILRTWVEDIENIKPEFEKDSFLSKISV